jgi:hypothetical protein
MSTSEAKRFKELESENARLKLTFRTPFQMSR